jgi:hypothetical protein
MPPGREGPGEMRMSWLVLNFEAFEFVGAFWKLKTLKF